MHPQRNGTTKNVDRGGIVVEALPVLDVVHRGRISIFNYVHILVIAVLN